MPWLEPCSGALVAVLVDIEGALVVLGATLRVPGAVLATV